jgi:hypothetical protein
MIDLTSPAFLDLVRGPAPRQPDPEFKPVSEVEDMPLSAAVQALIPPHVCRPPLCCGCADAGRMVLLVRRENQGVARG